MKNRQLMVILTIILVVCLLSAGCTVLPTQNSGTSTGVTVPAETSAGPTPTDGLPAAPSGILRLWWSTRSTLNPLLDLSESGIAASRLVFEGLFQINASQQILPGLAQTISFDATGLTADLKLTGGRAFHDGSTVSADDIKACIDFILANPAQSAYAAALSNVVRADVIDELTIRLTLAQPDYWLAYRLTFPILPAASLSAAPFDLIPGTGLFRMEAYEAGKALDLRLADESEAGFAVRQIRLIEFESFNEAMKAFEDDRLDLVNLQPSDYRRYILRDSLRFGQYSGNEAIILAYNTNQKHLLSDPSRLAYLKRLLSTSALSVPGSSGLTAGVPVLPDSWLLDGADFSESDALEGLGVVNWPATSGQLVILVPSGDSLRMDLAESIGNRLDQAGITWRTSLVPADSYAAECRAGNYDLALLTVTLPAEPDPMWLYSDSRPLSFAELGTLAGTGLEDYDIWRSRLQASATLAAMNRQTDVGIMARNLFKTAVRSPWSVLLIRASAILYGDRVIGQILPDRYHPYRGIEELWIWSGQSS